jgi:hypothetical protein
MANIPDDMKPKRINDTTVEFLGITFVETPKVPESEKTWERVAKPAKLAKVKLTGVDGNAFSLIAVCVEAARKAKYTPEQIQAFKDECFKGDNGYALNTCVKWFEVR